MAMKYAIESMITEDGLYSSSEDAEGIYVVENLCGVRPSFPFRTTGIGTTSGNIPEWICADLGEAKRPTLVALFNHSFELSQSGDELTLQACDEACPPQSGACDWDLTPASGGPPYSLDLSDRLLANHKNLYKIFDSGADYEFWRTSMIDAGNTYSYLEIGEWFLGIAESFEHAYLQPGRADGPVFFRGENITEYGQIWSNYLAEAKSMTITIKNIGDPAQVNDLERFLQRVQRAKGKFIFIPDDSLKFVYYMYLLNASDFGSQIVRGKGQKELKSWNLHLRSLTEGVALVG